METLRRPTRLSLLGENTACKVCCKQVKEKSVFSPAVLQERWSSGQVPKRSPQLEDKEERGKARDGKAANLGLGPVEGASPPAPQR